MTAAVGLLIRGSGSLDWWVISITVEIVVEVEARAQILWCDEDYGPYNLPDVHPGPIILKLTFSVTASASAEACIGSGWFSVCRSISASVPMVVNHELPI